MKLLINSTLIVLFSLSIFACDALTVDPLTQQQQNQELLYAVSDGVLWAVQEFLAQGADVNACNGKALQLAAVNGYLYIVKLLVAYGATITDRALQCAAEYAQWDVVIYLLQHGANITALTFSERRNLSTSPKAQKYMVDELGEALNNLDFIAVEHLLSIIPLEKFPQELQDEIWNF